MASLLKKARLQSKLNKFNDRLRKLQDKASSYFMEDYYKQLDALGVTPTQGKKYKRINMRDLKQGKSLEEVDRLLNQLLKLDTAGQYKKKTKLLKDDLGMVPTATDAEVWSYKQDIENFFEEHRDEIAFYMDGFEDVPDVMHIKGRRKTYGELKQAMEIYQANYLKAKGKTARTIEEVEV